jgi:uncharacterized protein YeaO (DUF488 family)
MHIHLCRIYDHEQIAGYRVLVDRLWPRSITKEAAQLDGWPKDLAPSAPLRKWFNHEDQKWTAFRQHYLDELNTHQQAVRDLLEDAKGAQSLILLYGAKSPHCNHAVVLKEFLEQCLRDNAPPEYASPVCYAGQFDT